MNAISGSLQVPLRHKITSGLETHWKATCTSWQFTSATKSTKPTGGLQVPERNMHFMAV